MVLASDDIALTGVWFEGQKHFPLHLADSEKKETPVIKRTMDWLDCYFQGRQPEFTPPLRPSGTPFQIAVWNILRKIPYGQTVTYKDIARQIMADGHMSAQAVGGAVGRNPISVIIPCHRVVGSDGSLTGYAGGIEKKLQLLTIEHVDTTRLFVPKP